MRIYYPKTLNKNKFWKEMQGKLMNIRIDNKQCHDFKK